MLNKTEHCKPVVHMHHGVFVVTRVSLQLPVMIMPREWNMLGVERQHSDTNVKNKGDVHSCSNYRGIHMISHTMKLWKVVERRLRSELTFSEQQYPFMPGKSNTDALFALRVLMEKYREGQKELHCVSVDLEKAYDKVPREEVWHCMRKSGLAE